MSIAWPSLLFKFVRAYNFCGAQGFYPPITGSFRQIAKRFNLEEKLRGQIQRRLAQAGLWTIGQRFDHEGPGPNINDRHQTVSGWGNILPYFEAAIGVGCGEGEHVTG